MKIRNSVEYFKTKFTNKHKQQPHYPKQYTRTNINITFQGTLQLTGQKKEETFAKSERVQ